MKISLTSLQNMLSEKVLWSDVLNKLTMAGIELEGQINDVIELKITPNRGDCLSIRGLVREISALTGIKVKPAVKYELYSLINDQIEVNIKVPYECPNYNSLIIKNINNQVVTPTYIKNFLNDCAFKSVSPIVDILNYIMLELGQPMHVFDLAKVGHKLSVRFAKTDEEIQLLDGKVIQLKPQTLVIAASDDKAAAIAGVMGSADYSITDTTLDIVLESAFFMPEVIASQAKLYGINSDAAYRFERGVDKALATEAILYAAKLITEICGGTVATISSKHTNLAKPVKLQIKYQEINKLIGLAISKNTVDNILTSLGFEISKLDEFELSVTVPSFRFDILLKEDLIEEVARVFGYDNIPAILPNITQVNPADANIDRINLQCNFIKNTLVTLGYSEIMSYAFHEESLEHLAGSQIISPVKLKNSIAGLSVMRTSLMTDLLKSLIYNINHGYKTVRLFELARVFYGTSEELQPLKIAGLIYGSAFELGLNIQREVNFYDVKQHVMLLLSHINGIHFVADQALPLLHSGRCAQIYKDKKSIGYLGQLNPQVGQSLNLVSLPYLFELDINNVLDKDIYVKIQLNKISKFPKVERDLAFLIHKNMPIGPILDAIKIEEIPYLTAMNVFDIYQGTNVQDLYKSVAIRFLFQAHKTLSESEINQSIEKIVNLMQVKFQITLRK